MGPGVDNAGKDKKTGVEDKVGVGNEVGINDDAGMNDVGMADLGMDVCMCLQRLKALKRAVGVDSQVGVTMRQV